MTAWALAWRSETLYKRRCHGKQAVLKCLAPPTLNKTKHIYIYTYDITTLNIYIYYICYNSLLFLRCLCLGLYRSFFTWLRCFGMRDSDIKEAMLAVTSAPVGLFEFYRILSHYVTPTQLHHICRSSKQ